MKIIISTSALGPTETSQAVAAEQNLRRLVLGRTMMMENEAGGDLSIALHSAPYDKGRVLWLVGTGSLQRSTYPGP